MQLLRQQRPDRSDQFQLGDRGSGGLEIERSRMRDMLAHADHVLDSMTHLSAEQYLAQNRQTGGE